MKRDLKVIGTTEINGVEIPNVLGGFGDGKKSLTDKAIGEIHSQPCREIRRRINDNISRFKLGIDYINLKDVGESHDNLLSNLYSNMEISKADKIYLLSERGYAKLIKIMDSDLAWDIHDKIIDEYFAMREIINSDEDLKKELLFKLYQGGTAGVEASKKLVDLETKPLLDKLKLQQPKVEYVDAIEASNDVIDFGQMAKLLNTAGFEIGRNNLTRLLRTKGSLIKSQCILMTDTYEWNGKTYTNKNHNVPFQTYIDRGYFETSQYVLNEKIKFKVLITPKGQQWLIKLFKQIELNKTA